MPTKTELRTLDAIKRYSLQHGYAPTLEELGAMIGVKSKGTVHRYVSSLTAQGLLERSKGQEWRSATLTEQASEGLHTLPLLGKIAAGRPIEAVAEQESLSLSDLLIRPDRYALRVQGESMIDAGILDGDTVIVQQRSRASDGEIVVALIDQDEATLKYIEHRQDGSIALIAANSTIPPMIYPAHRITIQGVVVGQFRTY